MALIVLSLMFLAFPLLQAVLEQELALQQVAKELVPTLTLKL